MRHLATQKVWTADSPACQLLAAIRCRDMGGRYRPPQSSIELRSMILLGEFSAANKHVRANGDDVLFGRPDL